MRRHAAGFTLLEMVLAMAAVAMISAICYGAFHVGIRAVQHGEVAVVTAQRLRVASDTLIRQVKSTVAYPARTEEEEEYPYFVGQSESMSFVTAAAQLGGGGLALVTYRIETDPPRIVLEETPFFSPDSLGGAADGGSPEARSAVLLDGFERASFAYLLDDGADFEWRNSWDAADEELLPAAIRIVVDHLPGLEMDEWGQEIPIMVTSYGEANAEVDEDAYPDPDEIDDGGGVDDEDVGDEGDE